VAYEYLHGFSEMFRGCDSLKYVNLSNWKNTNTMVDTYHMFDYCTSLEVVDLRNWDFVNIYDSSQMFNDCISLHTLRLDNCNNYVIDKIINSWRFPIGDIYKDGVRIPRNIYCKEENVVGLTPPSGWTFNHNIDEEVVIPPLPDYSPGLYRVGQFKNDSKITEVTTIVNESHTDLSYMFFSCSNLVSVNTQDWDTSNVTTMYGMFHGCSSLQSLDLSNFVTSKVTSMKNMFSNCSNLTSLDISNFDTSNVTDMDAMFMYCHNLHKLYLNNCSNDTISKIINSKEFPILTISNEDGTEFIPRIIYCKRANTEGLTPPTNWSFSYID
jgi:surface protein